MTTLDPSHNPSSSPSSTHAQAVHQPVNDPDPDLLSDSSSDISVDDHVRRERRAKREARQLVRQAMPPLPDLRFEQSYLVSIRPFLHPRPTAQAVEEKGGARESPDKRGAVVAAEDDAVYHWGRDVSVDWSSVIYVTLRDQFFSPLVQGALWGWGTLFLISTRQALSSALWPTTYRSGLRLTGGPGGSVSESGGGQVVGQTTGWWRRWIQSWGGAIETAAI